MLPHATVPSDLDIPLDGIIGNQVLSLFDWWYDYDGNRIWVRYTGG